MCAVGHALVRRGERVAGLQRGRVRVLGEEDGLPGLQRGRARARVLGDAEDVPEMEPARGVDGVSEIDPVRGLRVGGWFNILARYI